MEKEYLTGAHNALEQMRIYLKLHDLEKNSEEYSQVQIIFNGLILALGSSCYKNLLKTFMDTSRKIVGLHPKSLVYWSDYIKYVDWKLKAPPPNSLLRFTGFEELEQMPEIQGRYPNRSEPLADKYF